MPHAAVRPGAGSLKRALDVGIAGTLVLLAAPLALLIVAAVRLSSTGPAIYTQTRLGLNGRRFTIFKFRTMTSNAEAAGAPLWAVRNDPRCTRIGSLLRRTGLDELPQLWNVLRGEMSIVGPRPERPGFAGQFAGQFPDYGDRQVVRPGITGFAQVHGWRGNTDLTERLRHDLYYIRHWSLGFDMRVLLLTLRHAWSERTRNGIPG
jgi:lipopolysaccharide/colanic/teichoic acid biosynthesis glycosyltransferase